MKKPELLAPAGDLEKLKTALHYGADAVYLSGDRYGLRAGAENFSMEEMAAGVALAHKKGARAYLALNIFAHNADINSLPSYLREIEPIGVDAIIASDPGVIDLVKEVLPGTELHLSTQANTTNWRSIAFWKKQGVSRVCVARELSLDEIREIRDRVDVEIEAFVHG
ncbi:MAG: U32 family peptidase, partial [Deltaproteobacteria bacterium]|nr:U32 family peptidase [Deltaproteobacteria bacterium]